MARVVITAAADEDTANIIDDLANKAGGKVALRYEADFDALYRRLELFPESGAPRRKLGATVRHRRGVSVLDILSTRCNRRCGAYSPHSSWQSQHHAPDVAETAITAMIYGYARVSTPKASPASLPN